MKRLACLGRSCHGHVAQRGNNDRRRRRSNGRDHPDELCAAHSETCSNLPDGTSITWSGTGQSITRIRTDASGVTTIGNITHAHGIATDQVGNTYTFNYTNTFRISNTLADPAVFSGPMVDSFSLAGQGPIRLHAGFVADLHH